MCTSRTLGAIAASILLTLDWSALPATGQPVAPISKPSAARRIVGFFDFEEQDVNSEPVPMHWIRAQDAPPTRPRPGFPIWNAAAFDMTVSFTGQASVKLPTRGGSTALRLVPGVIPIIPGGDYQISAMVRTDNLLHARARIVAQYADGALVPLGGTERVSPLQETNGEWFPVSVLIPAGPPDAAWLTMELELLQPDLISGTSVPFSRIETTEAVAGRPKEPPLPPGEGRGERPAAEAHDLAGAAWFDDIVVRNVPNVSLTTVASSAITFGNESPLLSTVITDAVGERLVAEYRVVNLDGATVDARRIDPVEPGAEIRWRPRLPEFGWYRVEFTVAAAEETLLADTRNIVWLPRASPDSESQRMGLILNEWINTSSETLLDLLAASGVGAVELPYWSAGVTKDSLRRDIPRLATLMEQLLSKRLAVTFALNRLPSDLAGERRLDDDDVLAALLGQHETWFPWLDDSLTRFGQRVRRWRLGNNSTHALPAPLESSSMFLSAAEPIRTRVLNPIPTLGWPAEMAPPPGLANSGVDLLWPATMPPASILDLVPTWRDVEELSVVIESDDAEFVTPRAATTNLARRAIRAWQADPDRLLIAQPWVWRMTGRGPVADPAPGLPVWSRLGEHLRGRRVVGELPLTPGVVALILDGPGVGAIAAWNESAHPADARLDAYLADGPVRVYDLMGNQTTIDVTGGTHRIDLPESPIFIEGVDAKLARFRAGFRVEPPMIESTAERHIVTVVLTNPWSVTMSGDLRLTAPAGWTFTPRTIPFTIAPGEEAGFPVEVAFGVSEEAGVHTLRAEARLIATNRYPTITISAPVSIGLSGVDLIPSYLVRRHDGVRDVIVTLLVLNTGDAPATMTTFAQAPNMKRQQAPISDIPARGAAVRRFIFRDVGEALLQRDIQVGVIQGEGLGRLTRRVRIE